MTYNELVKHLVEVFSVKREQVAITFNRSKPFRAFKKQFRNLNFEVSETDPSKYEPEIFWGMIPTKTVEVHYQPKIKKYKKVLFISPYVFNGEEKFRISSVSLN